MNIAKAIELNKESEKSLRSHKFIEYADAVKLGIEALNRLIELRQLYFDPPREPLPGETEE